MATLLDAIQQNSQPQKQGQTDTTQSLQGLLRAKSGKQVGGGDTVSSNLGEQSEVAQTNSQLQNQVAPQAAIQQQGLQQQQAGQQQQADIQGQQIEQQKSFNTIQSNLKTNQILSDLERQKGQIDMNTQKANLEQVGFNLRLQNQQYVDNLQMEGQKARLDDANQFRQELTKTMFDDNQQVLEDKLGKSTLLDASDNSFRHALAQMSVDDAWGMFNANKEAEKQRALYSGIGALATAGVGAAGGASAPQQGGAGGQSSASSGGEATGDIGAGGAGAVAQLIIGIH